MIVVSPTVTPPTIFVSQAHRGQRILAKNRFKTHPEIINDASENRPRKPPVQRSQEWPWSDPRAPKTTPRQAQERPKSARRVAQRALEAMWGPRGSRGPLGRFLDPLGGLDDGPIRGSLFEASSASCGALPGAGTSAKAQEQGAQSQGQQAARPTSLKDSGARRDVRSTLI